MSHLAHKKTIARKTRPLQTYPTSSPTLILQFGTTTHPVKPPSVYPGKLGRNSNVHFSFLHRTRPRLIVVGITFWDWNISVWRRDRVNVGW